MKHLNNDIQTFSHKGSAFDLHDAGLVGQVGVEARADVLVVRQLGPQRLDV